MYIACCHPRKVTKNNLADNTSLLCNTKVMCCSNLLCGRRMRLDSSRRAHMSMCNLSRRVPLLVLVSYHRQTDRLLPKFQRSFTKGVCCSPACIADATVRTHILGLNHTGLRRIPLRDRGASWFLCLLQTRCGVKQLISASASQIGIKRLLPPDQRFRPLSCLVRSCIKHC